MKNPNNPVMTKTIPLVVLCAAIALTGCNKKSECEKLGVSTYYMNNKTPYVYDIYVDGVYTGFCPANTFESGGKYPLGLHTVEARHVTADDHTFTVELTCFDSDTLVLNP